MFVPYATDAPVYHWPLGTVGLIAVNVGVFVAMATGGIVPDPVTAEPWVMQYGQGLRPIEWLASRFSHAGLEHLLGNMIFLWVFGLVVEGKLGTLRFLPIYLAIAIGEAAVEQTLLLGATEGGSLGASAAIYGLLAIAAVWAPENDIRFFYWLALYIGTIEVPLLTVAALYIGWDLTAAVLFGGMGQGVTSGLLHVLGAAVGAPIGVLLLKRGVVDCEGWDIFSRYGGVKKDKRSKEAPHEEATQRAEQALREEKSHGAARDQIAAYLKAGNAAAAATLYGKVRGVGGGLKLDAATLQGVASGLQAAERWAELAPVLAELIELAPQAADPLRLRLAQLCVTKLDRPGRALDLVAAARPEALSDKGRTLARQITDRAHAMQKTGLVELDDGGW